MEGFTLDASNQSSLALISNQKSEQGKKDLRNQKKGRCFVYMMKCFCSLAVVSLFYRYFVFLFVLVEKQ